MDIEKIKVIINVSGMFGRLKILFENFCYVMIMIMDSSKYWPTSLNFY